MRGENENVAYDGGAVDVTNEKDKEAYEVLMSLAHGQAWLTPQGAIPKELVVRSVMDATTEFDWPVRRAALEALLRRISVAQKSDLRVVKSRGGQSLIPKGTVFGRYVLCDSRSNSKINIRPYETIISSIDPLKGSCSCPDYLTNSLGLCKHLLVCFNYVFSSQTKHRRAVNEQGLHQTNSSSRLIFLPYRPGFGDGDMLNQICWQSGRDLKLAGVSKRISDLVKKRFSSDGSGVFVLKETFANNPAKRIELVSDLLRIQGSPRQSEAQDPTMGFDPAARALLLQEQKRLRSIVKKLMPVADVRKILKSMRVALYPYQLAGVEKFFKTGRMLLADEMGLGKTAQAIAVSHILVRSKLIKRGLVVVPASLKAQWKREWECFTDTPICVVDGSPEERKAIYESCSKGILLVHYEQLIRDLDPLFDWHPEFMVVDEAQRIKNWQTKTASSIKVFNPEFRLVLTGTPMENRLEELASLLDWIEPFALEPKWRLVPWYSTFGDGENGASVIGARNLDVLRQRIAGCTLRRRRNEVLTDLPGRMDTIIPIKMTELQQSYHEDLTMPIARLVHASKHRPLTHSEFLRLMQLLTSQRILCDGLELYEFKTIWPELRQIQNPGMDVIQGMNSPKLKEFREIIEQVVIAQKRKVVVFSQWRQMLQLADWSVEGVLAEAGLRSVFFTGKESRKRRTQNLVEFHDDSTAAVLFCTDAGGVGLNLQKAANCCVILDLPWNPAVLEQRIGRIYRNGQKQPVDIYKIVCLSGIEARIEALVGSKKKVFDGLFDQGSDEVMFENQGRFCDRLERMIEPLVAKVSDIEGELGEDELETESDIDGVLDIEQAIEDPLEDMQDMQDDGQIERVVPGNSDSSSFGNSYAKVKEIELLKDADSQDKSAVDNRTSDLRPDLLSSVKIERLANGHMRIDAPPEAAKSMAIMFEAMAQLMRSAG